MSRTVDGVMRSDGVRFYRDGSAVAGAATAVSTTLPPACLHLRTWDTIHTSIS
jgi:hypothetical protein